MYEFFLSTVFFLFIAIFGRYLSHHPMKVSYFSYCVVVNFKVTAINRLFMSIFDNQNCSSVFNVTKMI